MNMNRDITALVERAIVAHTFPGCVVGYIREGRTEILAFGTQRYDSSGAPVNADTIYDVASVTKSVVTGAVAAKLIEAGRLNLDDGVARYIPELSNHYRDAIRLRHLLTYTLVFDLDGGLSSLAKRAPKRLLEELCASALAAPPGEKYVYTNAPALLLATIIERVCGEPLDVLAKRYFFDPLGMDLSSMHPELLPRFQIAPTEIDWRGEVRAVVHDEAAWAMAQQGRLAGDAGLFSAAGDLLKFCQMLLDHGRVGTSALLASDTVRQMHTNQIASLGECTGLGWELNSPLTLDVCTGIGLSKRFLPTMLAPLKTTSP